MRRHSGPGSKRSARPHGTEPCRSARALVSPRFHDKRAWRIDLSPWRRHGTATAQRLELMKQERGGEGGESSVTRLLAGRGGLTWGEWWEEWWGAVAASPRDDAGRLRSACGDRRGRQRARSRRRARRPAD